MDELSMQTRLMTDVREDSVSSQSNLGRCPKCNSNSVSTRLDSDSKVICTCKNCNHQFELK